MTVSLVHISDLHLRENWFEEQGIVLDAFFSDLSEQVKLTQDCYFIFSGDVVQAGENPNFFNFFDQEFLPKLSQLGFGKDSILVVPGNHDIDRSYTNHNLAILRGFSKTDFGETEFNNHVYSSQFDTVKMKFVNFIDWQSKISSFQLGFDGYAGKGFALSHDIGVYCLNTALFSFGGLSEQGGIINDKGILPVETRNLQQWVQKTSFKRRILVMHHPESWLVDWAQKAISQLCVSKFDLVLTGHVHEGGSVHSYDGSSGVVRCSAPALFTRKNEQLGYSIITVDDRSESIGIRYRQWFDDRFLTGVNLSKTDNGEVWFGSDLGGVSKLKGPSSNYDSIASNLKASFNSSLKCYASLPTIWVEPCLSDALEFSPMGGESIVHDASKFFERIQDCIIKAPPQFGLTSLGRYFSWYSWDNMPGRYTLFINSPDVQNHEAAISKFVDDKMDELSLTRENLHCIVLDEPGEIIPRKINNIKKIFPHVPVVVLLRVGEVELTREVKVLNSEEIGEFDTYYLWSFSRSQVRDFVRAFISSGMSLDEDWATQRLIDDIENLNLHRTPINCLTLLAVYERQMDYSPINRTEMFERFLFLLFSSYKKNPDYSVVPDMKDALYVLGHFCENLIREGKTKFSKIDFVKSSSDFCEERSIDVDCMHLFDIMLNENVLIKCDNYFQFRYLHWVYFFGAHRMNHDKDFKKFVLSESFYMNFPEIIEFYSGLDRQREELIEVLASDLRVVNDAFEARTKIDPSFDPYELALWTPSNDGIEKIKEKLAEEAGQSALPVSLKDQIADQGYDRGQPYSQELRKFVQDSSLIECFQTTIAAARALRNSDYVNSDVKGKLLSEIMRSWSKTLQVLFILSPVLAKDRRATFDNILFSLGPSFKMDNEWEVQMKQIINSIPFNVITWHEKDISSARMTPLFKDFMDNENGEIPKFILAGVMVRSRPSKWKEVVASYITNLPKNSYYLLKLFGVLRHEYRYGFVSKSSQSDLMDLMGLITAKHSLGSKSPNKKAIEKAKQGIFKSFKKSEDKVKD